MYNNDQILTCQSKYVFKNVLNYNLKSTNLAKQTLMFTKLKINCFLTRFRQLGWLGMGGLSEKGTFPGSEPFTLTRYLNLKLRTYPNRLKFFRTTILLTDYVIKS